ncbi:ferritin-like domain-containing protein [Mesorhizobium retamae]|uniref:Ferritin-like domain-containing protein n=1 Tax=Mesorhizobium retamae TaxID=2912854 RepID=A0ABS9QLS9_9HYPH|nr:ferritin-like domain-containing protein [Mesorhizobium sp. IRAMC:0171]MCG7508404.1 ferritin-like domain-containing protein [Mesorhizobium sp. IRAMC:0171]
MSESREWLVQWLRDAHAMEEQAITMLSGQIDRIENYPELRDRMQMHLDETREQAARIRRCLDELGHDASTAKDAGGKLIAMGQSFSGIFAGDEVMKGSLASYTFEHMEIASYTILLAAAETLGETAIAKVCEQNLREEKAMAEWLQNHLPDVANLFLRRANMESDAAKR